ncbi:L-serine dehydratase [Vibrio crassostreae]|nr:L-serine dehydratase [Vibrio crassostreae]CAK3041435.1 L-serine dehydratase [Vibrio crassostreae]CAK3041780.1 L-serine dehydratase [Vibrio crassostreae]CAK3044040.1 L-serine dehydratase [Vibrio crassostreae]CAK3044136.1 L-serine dehydratase [Vibrio crassostreae]
MSVELYPSFFNDVMGPVMLAGSSSHLVAPQRLGLLCHYLTRSHTLEKIEVIMDTEGSFAGTFGLMSEDIGMCSGAIGLPVDSPVRNSCLEMAKEQGISVAFTKAPMNETDHLNGMKFVLTTQSGKQFTLVGDSIGGGMVQTKKIMGFDYIYKGDTNLIVVIEHENQPIDLETVKQQVSGVMSCKSVDGVENKTAHFLTASDAPNLAVLKATAPQAEIYWLECVLPTPTLPNRGPQLFDNSTDFLALSEEKPMHEVAIDYQVAATGMSREEVISKVEELRGHMVYLVKRMDNRDFDLDYKHAYGFNTGNFDKVAKNSFLTQPLADAVRYYFSVSAMAPETLHVGFPHGAGGGVVMSCLHAAQNHYGFSDEKMVEGLLVAAAYGAIAYTRTDPTGETIGCAGEMGLSGAFSAAALTYILGGTPRQVDSAASQAMQLSVGWPCDPIMGGEGEPCTSRGMAVITTPFTYMQLALSNMLTLIPFHEALDVASQVGEKLGADMLCTGRGGCAACPSACAVKVNLGI